MIVGVAKYLQNLGVIMKGKNLSFSNIGPSRFSQADTKIWTCGRHVVLGASVLCDPHVPQKYVPIFKPYSGLLRAKFKD